MTLEYGPHALPSKAVLTPVILQPKKVNPVFCDGESLCWAVIDASPSDSECKWHF